MDKIKSPDKERFAAQFNETFDPTNESNIKPKQCASCEDFYEDGEMVNGDNRWFSAAQFLQ